MFLISNLFLIYLLEWSSIIVLDSIIISNMRIIFLWSSVFIKINLPINQHYLLAEVYSKAWSIFFPKFLKCLTTSMGTVIFTGMSHKCLYLTYSWNLFPTIWIISGDVRILQLISNPALLLASLFACRAICSSVNFMIKHEFVIACW